VHAICKDNLPDNVGWRKDSTSFVIFFNAVVSVVFLGNFIHNFKQLHSKVVIGCCVGGVGAVEGLVAVEFGLVAVDWVAVWLELGNSVDWSES